jgi:hypothetical protein
MNISVQGSTNKTAKKIEQGSTRTHAEHARA